MWKFSVFIRLAVLIGLLISSSTSQADEYSACLRANSASDKIELCSLVIRHSRQARQLERAYLRRGNAYAEVNRFADAVSDFTSLIQINPKVAGYYDNRQYALKSMGLRWIAVYFDGQEKNSSRDKSCNFFVGWKDVTLIFILFDTSFSRGEF